MIKHSCPKLESTHTHFPRDAFQSQVFKNLNKASLPLGLLCEIFFGGRDRRFKKRNKFGFWEEINFYTFTEQLSKNLIFVFSVDFWEAFFFVLSPRLIMRALLKSCQSSRSNFHPKTEIKGKKSKKSEAYYHLWAWWELFSVQFLCWFVLFSKGKDKP